MPKRMRALRLAPQWEAEGSTLAHVRQFGQRPRRLARAHITAAPSCSSREAVAPGADGMAAVGGVGGPPSRRLQGGCQVRRVGAAVQ